MDGLVNSLSRPPSEAMQTSFRKPVRISQPGDICLLLETDDPTEIQRLSRRQEALQSLYGGKLMEPVHLTCQRFMLSDQKHYPELVDMLVEFSSYYKPFLLQAKGLMLYYSQYRQMNLLKWEIHVRRRLESFSARLESLLHTPWTTSLYTPGWVSTLVTALVDIDSPPPVTADRLPRLSHPLFTPTILSISMILGPGTYKILDKIPLAKV